MKLEFRLLVAGQLRALQIQVDRPAAPPIAIEAQPKGEINSPAGAWLRCDAAILFVMQDRMRSDSVGDRKKDPAAPANENALRLLR